jgi:hypothetical protein
MVMLTRRAGDLDDGGRGQRGEMVTTFKILLIFPLSHDYVTNGYVITSFAINKYTKTLSLLLLLLSRGISEHVHTTRR